MLEWMCVWSSECDMLCKSALTARVEKWHVKTSPFTWGTVVSACECVDGHEIRVFDLILHWKTKLCLFIALKWDAVTSLVWMGVCAGVRQHSETQCCFSKAGISHLQLFKARMCFLCPCELIQEVWWICSAADFSFRTCFVGAERFWHGTDRN